MALWPENLENDWIILVDLKKWFFLKGEKSLFIFYPNTCPKNWIIVFNDIQVNSYLYQAVNGEWKNMPTGNSQSSILSKVRSIIDGLLEMAEVMPFLNYSINFSENFYH
jgi:hypothetical protein